MFDTVQHYAWYYQILVGLGFIGLAGALEYIDRKWFEGDSIVGILAFGSLIVSLVVFWNML